ncbi:ComEA family DNA-binding protein [Brevibacillus fulvus]|uniref:Competence protein ComEA n=1 Tax=Brevibacillus fulvus TaxID=1125967 RepID=A0A938XYD1_9BACL|nr:ComEA family DNA-binding protein [Brevibacillus fulvus]MBM7589903.1 competence protein ComEA [Brevibacillus fulvus]
MLVELWERYQRWIIAGGIVLLCLLSLWLYSRDAKEGGLLPLHAHALTLAEQPAAKTGQPVGNGPADSEQSNRQAEQLIVVDVKGSVKQPGVYQLQEGQRISDAIARAGGALPTADLNRINLAQRLSDESIVRIPAKGEADAAACACETEPAVIIGTSSATDSGKVNINTANATELMNLPGIGETRAAAILAYREKHGPFQTPADLKKVTGIGEKTYDQLKNNITVK